MIVQQVTTVEDAQIVREIRNSVRQYMTRDTREITETAQAEWFNRQTGLLYLYYAELLDGTTTPIGFGYLRDIEDVSWGTLALFPVWQNMGYGTQIYRHLISLTNRLYIEIMADNISSMRAAINAGFNIEYVGDRVIVFSAKRNRV